MLPAAAGEVRQSVVDESADRLGEVERAVRNCDLRKGRVEGDQERRKVADVRDDLADQRAQQQGQPLDDDESGDDVHDQYGQPARN